jgi:hypothetical protein
MVLLFQSVLAHANPCDGVDQTLTAQQRDAFAPAIEAHLNSQLGPVVQQRITTAASDVLKLLRVGRWHIVHVNTHVSDDPFLVYSSSPTEAKAYLVAWSGAARLDEGPSIRRWLVKEAPGIPKQLATCFAWRVTHRRDM